MGGAGSTYGGPEGKLQLGDIGVDWRTVLNWVLRE